MNDKPLHNRRSIRLKGYDYSKSGAYFITVCLKDKIHFFGKIENGEIILNDAGTMLDKWWQKIPEKFPDIVLGEYQIMPNHFHAIVINVGADPRVRPSEPTPNNDIVRADPRVRPENKSSDSNESSNSVLGQTHGSAPTENSPNDIVRADPRVRPKNELLDSNKSSNSNVMADWNDGQTHGSAPTGSSLQTVVQWFKTMSSNEYIHGVKKLGWRPFYGKLWQRNYYEHIIREEKSYNSIAEYIINNPANWENDIFK